MASITYDNACCVYPGADKLAVDSLNLDIADGEFVVLVGPSGSGKSTALRMLAGLEEIDSGAINIGGTNMVGVAPKDRDIAMVFQNYALYPNKTVGENMGFALKMRGIGVEERKQKVADAAKLLDLTDFLDRKPGKLSGGQRQRVAMGRAIVRDPQVFCMDEPLSNLDAKLRVQTRTQIAALQRRLGTTTVYVTHDQVEAMTMGDRVAVLRDGKLQQFSTPTELYDRPVNAFVAGFIGSPAMNLFTAPLTDDGVTIGGSTVAVPRTALAGIGKLGLDSAIVGVRPEAFSLSDTGDGVPATVSLLEELGSETYVYATVDDPAVRTIDGGEVTLVSRTSVRGPAKIGEQIRLQQSDPTVHLFHPTTGERLGD
ncbi:ABC transporter ATP-binding protein [Williamsia phyllosphaerae]|uniref:ABC transporter ATP-binding protein n=1 Tax=Williamsia phyllosphaerae TaxID=885042 RepID=A0ABQ1UYB0_9NOCA|nr:ATP-binding cassette domain-containing protein [Williamsia phyllosphaerae]GGF29800.1 ABC transporter ATP-binding protein [Williamsia phyllosphaerae]